jgi:hypothetical protein
LLTQDASQLVGGEAREFRAVEGRFSRQQLVQESAQAVDVAAGIGF